MGARELAFEAGFVPSESLRLRATGVRNKRIVAWFGPACRMRLSRSLPGLPPDKLRTLVTPRTSLYDPGPAVSYLPSVKALL